MEQNQLHYGISLKLYFENKAFGPGMSVLLRGVESTGSLQGAAQAMNMAYSKAWRIVKKTEEALGLKLFIRQGASGSSLTKEGRALVTIFRQVEDELAQKASEALDRAFEECEKEGLFLPEAPEHIGKKASPELIAQVRSIERHVVTR